MNEELIISILFENPLIIKSDKPEIEKYKELLFTYRFDELIELIKSEKKLTDYQFYFKARAYYYKYDLDNCYKIINEKIKRDSTIFKLLNIEYLILKRKVQELSGFGRLSSEISRLAIELSKHEDPNVTSLAKTFEGDNFSLMNEYYSAMKSYEESISINGDNLRSKIGYAKSLYYLERYDEAFKEFEQLSTIYNSSSIHKYKGKIYKKKKEFESAIKSFKYTVELDPNYIDAYFDLFEIYRKRKQVEDANKIIERISKKFPYFTNASEFLYYYALNFYLQDKFDIAIDLLKKLSKRKYESHYTLYLIGKILSKKGVSLHAKKERILVLEEAQEYFTAAIDLYNNEIDLLKNTEEINSIVIRKLQNQLKKCMYSSAITLSHLDKYEDSINILKKLLEDEPDNYYYTKSIAIGYNQFNKFDLAIQYFNKAISYFDNPDVKIFNNSKASLLREFAFCLMKENKYNEGLKWVSEAINYNPTDYKIYLTLGEIQYYLNDLKNAKKNITLYLKNDIDLKYSDLAVEVLKLIDYAGKRIIPNHREIRKKEIIEKFNSLDINGNQIRDAENRFHNIINKSKTINKNKNLLYILRKWNSYTPLLNTLNSKGGGYFISYNGEGLVIDPGLNFLENFFSLNLSLRDINHIFISHAHNDHMADLESIITLLYKYNTDPKNKKKKHRINLYMNIGAYKKFVTNLNLKDNTSVEKLTILNPETNYNISTDISLETIKANHDEILSDSYCLSFVFRLGKKTITFTNDSGYTEEYGNKIHQSNPDILIAHIGTIKEFEFKSLDYYSKHLGINGLMEVLEKSQASFNVISEFGEELKHLRGNIAQSLAEVFNKSVIPGDIGIQIDIDELSIKESFPPDFPPGDYLHKIRFLKPEEASSKELSDKIYIYNNTIKDPDKYIGELLSSQKN